MENKNLSPELIMAMFQETNRLFHKNQEEMRRISEETDKKFQKSQETTDKKFEQTRKEIDRMSRETNNNINKIIGESSSRWGKLLEALVQPASLKLFKERNVDITRSYKNYHVNIGKLEAEFDIILANGTEVVIIEVKTDVTIRKIEHFLKNLSHIHEYMPEYKDKKIYGAIAGLKYSSQSDKYAYKKGLFVIKSNDENILKISNDNNFTPKIF